MLNGDFNQELVVSAVKLIEEKCRIRISLQTLITKLKHGVEVLQNISKHKHNDIETLPYFIIGTNAKMVSMIQEMWLQDRLNMWFRILWLFTRVLPLHSLKLFYRDSLRNIRVGRRECRYWFAWHCLPEQPKVTFSFSEYKDNLYHFGLNVNIINGDNKKRPIKYFSASEVKTTVTE